MNPVGSLLCCGTIFVTCQKEPNREQIGRSSHFCSNALTVSAQAEPIEFPMARLLFAESYISSKHSIISCFCMIPTPENNKFALKPTSVGEFMCTLASWLKSIL